jgi:hypothetical protein
VIAGGRYHSLILRLHAVAGRQRERELQDVEERPGRSRRPVVSASSQAVLGLSAERPQTRPNTRSDKHIASKNALAAFLNPVAPVPALSERLLDRTYDGHGESTRP